MPASRLLKIYPEVKVIIPFIKGISSEPSKVENAVSDPDVGRDVDCCWDSEFEILRTRLPIHECISRRDDGLFPIL